MKAWLILGRLMSGRRLLPVLALLCATSWAAEPVAGPSTAPPAGQKALEQKTRQQQTIEQQIQHNLEQSRSDLVVSSVEQSGVAGLYTVQLEQGPTLYVTADARHFVVGDLFRIEPTGLVNLAEQQREKARAELISQVPREQTIVFSPKGETRAVVNIFTDVECPWCQRQHAEVPALNALGIEVRYLAYPRAGAGSPAYRKMVSAWCADDRQDALSRLKKQQPIADNQCKDNPVQAQYELGNRLGVNGTPALITETGRLLPGYMSADQLAAAIGLKPAD